MMHGRPRQRIAVCCWPPNCLLSCGFTFKNRPAGVMTGTNVEEARCRLDLAGVPSALCIEFEPQVRRYRKCRQYQKLLQFASLRLQQLQERILICCSGNHHAAASAASPKIFAPTNRDMNACRGRWGRLESKISTRYDSTFNERETL